MSRIPNDFAGGGIPNIRTSNIRPASIQSPNALGSVAEGLGPISNALGQLALATKKVEDRKADAELTNSIEAIHQEAVDSDGSSSEVFDKQTKALESLEMDPNNPKHKLAVNRGLRKALQLKAENLGGESLLLHEEAIERFDVNVSLEEFRENEMSLVKSIKEDDTITDTQKIATLRRAKRQIGNKFRSQATQILTNLAPTKKNAKFAQEVIDRSVEVSVQPTRQVYRDTLLAPLRAAALLGELGREKFEFLAELDPGFMSDDIEALRIRMNEKSAEDTSAQKFADRMLSLGTDPTEDGKPPKKVDPGVSNTTASKSWQIAVDEGMPPREATEIQVGLGLGITKQPRDQFMANIEAGEFVAAAQIWGGANDAAPSVAETFITSLPKFEQTVIRELAGADGDPQKIREIENSLSGDRAKALVKKADEILTVTGKERLAFDKNGVFKPDLDDEFADAMGLNGWVVDNEYVPSTSLTRELASHYRFVFTAVNKTRADDDITGTMQEVAERSSQEMATKFTSILNDPRSFSETVGRFFVGKTSVLMRRQAFGDQTDDQLKRTVKRAGRYFNGEYKESLRLRPADVLNPIRLDPLDAFADSVDATDHKFLSHVTIGDKSYFPTINRRGKAVAYMVADMANPGDVRFSTILPEDKEFGEVNGQFVTSIKTKDEKTFRSQGMWTPDIGSKNVWTIDPRRANVVVQAAHAEFRSMHEGQDVDSADAIQSQEWMQILDRLARSDRFGNYPMGSAQILPPEESK